MVIPERMVKHAGSLFLVSTLLVGGLLGCSGSGDDSADGVGVGVGDVLSANPGPTESDTPVIPFCTSPGADEDGDGFGFEAGASCRVSTNFAAIPKATIDEITHIVVVTGQSNVEAPETAFDEELDKPHPRVFAFTDEGWQIADLHQVWDENAHPGNHSLTDPNNSPNNNFVFHYGRSLAQLDTSAVPAFIVLAAPGRGIAHWDYESPFYWKMRNKINSALSQIPHRNTIDVMLWHQGESDWLSEGTSDPDATEFTVKDSWEYDNYYRLKLDRVIANFRSEPWATPNLPFICGETRIAEGVNQHLNALNNNGDSNSACVATSDLPYRLTDPTGNHYSAAGLRELGRRYMQQYRSIVGL